MALTDKQRRFCEEYVKDWNATQAAIRSGYSEKTAGKIGFENLSKPEIVNHLDTIRRKLTEEAEFTPRHLLKELQNQITADPRDLVEVRRECCRFCYGVDFRYQETPAERRSRHDAHQALLKVTPEKEWKNIPAFDEMGGLGFNPKKPPVEDCPECFGDGQERVIIKDTRTLSPAAARLYRGAKQTKEGLEIKMAPIDKAVDMYGKHFGLWAEKEDGDRGSVKIVISGGLPQDEHDA